MAVQLYCLTLKAFMCVGEKSKNSKLETILYENHL